MGHARIVVVGSVAFDHIMELPGKISSFIVPEKINNLNVSFTVKTLRKEFGGTGGNCAYALGLLEKKPLLVSSWGKDAEAYREHMLAVNVDIASVMTSPDVFSAWGHVMTDDNDNQLWMFYPGALKDLLNYPLSKVVEENDFVALLPSQPEVYREHLRQAVDLGVDFMFDPAFFVPNLSVDDLWLGVDHAKVVIANEYEIELMSKRLGTGVEDWLHDDNVVVKTLAGSGSIIYHQDQVWRIPAAKAKRVVEPTGAGDTYRAGFLAGFTAGLPLQVCGRMGSVAAVYVVEKDGTQTYGYTKQEFKQRYQENYAEILNW